MNKPYVLVFGASVVDMFGFCGKTYRAYDSIPGKVKISFGGVARNIAENMARVGINTQFISILGDDEMGKSIMRHSDKIGYDMSNSLVVEDGSTPTYMAILDENGEMVSAVADMKTIDALTKEFIDSKKNIIEHALYTFVDTDDPENLEHLLSNYYTKTKFVLDPVSTAKAKGVKHLLKYFHTIKPNRYEAEVLSGINIKTEEDLHKVGEYFLSLGIKNIFISLDGEGVYYTDGNIRGKLKANNVKVVNVTGAGDSFVAGIGYGYTNNFSLSESVKYAVAMSLITISHTETIHPDMGHDLVQEFISKTEWEETIY
ncbi:carbohydrate kinase family protein [Cetobacterium sp. SF1]|uniref:carbohydrate kinase family protein n=1 Tax=unclassified Cetobacterium TaxID=2630983 RepID=UPI003CEB44F0